jgi:transposase InsO family protein
MAGPSQSGTDELLRFLQFLQKGLGTALTLRREGTELNHKKLRRLYREERLQVRRRGGRKRALGTRIPIALPCGPNQRWSLDFLSDATIGGKRRYAALCSV